MILEKAAQQDFEAIRALYIQICDQMLATGNHQWTWGEYPNDELIHNDLDNGEAWVVREDSKVIAVVCVNEKQDEEYETVNWLFGIKPGLFHRLAIAPDAQGKGLGRKILADIEEILRGMGCDAMRCDTYAENPAALHLYATNGMRISGGGIFYGAEKPYTCFEKRLTEDCPLLPLPMTPAFRGGKLTPWGGDKLRTEFHKNIQEVPTGESLEVSCIPGLESTDDQGTILPELIARYGKAFAGKYAELTFPLLLKIIDANDSLSVQVHPNDAYAHDHENGKLGKTEAWLILAADEGAELVYGIQPGTDLSSLRTACEQGAAVSSLLRRVKVKPGDVCFIPAGCVHAIGTGIVLYEIQQSSDVTYRFYDWDRVDKNGNKRELHIDKALDVTDLSFSLDPVPAPDQESCRVLDTEYFTLDLLRSTGAPVELPAINDFAFLTALDADLTLAWQGTSRTIRKGESLYIPTCAPKMQIIGNGRAAISMPR